MGMDDVSTQAVMKRIAYVMAQIDDGERFARMALIADRHFISALVTICRSLIPLIEMKVFDSAQKDQAKRWVRSSTHKEMNWQERMT